jgi:translation initiation factor 2B subunit (eIF-2B alpha/beta/delta family)
MILVSTSICITIIGCGEMLEYVHIFIINDEETQLQAPFDPYPLPQTPNKRIILSSHLPTIVPSLASHDCVLLRRGRPYTLFNLNITPYLYLSTSCSLPHSPPDPMLRRLLLPRAVAAAIDDIREDHVSGARQLALKALSGLKLAVKESNEWVNLVNCAWYLSESRPSMKASITNAILRALHTIQDVFPDVLRCEHVLEEQIQEEGHTLEKISRNLVQLIHSQKPSSILTLSNSSTIHSALKALLTNPETPSLGPMTLTILESRPLFEGLSLARSLTPDLPPTITIQLAVDAAGAFLAAQSDIILIGADHISPSTGDVKNKIGSLAAVSLTRSRDRVFCVTSTDKISPSGVQEEEENDPVEVSAVWPPGEIEGILVRNPYFEWCPGRYFAGYVTERGVLLGEGVRRVYEERREWERIWEVLDPEEGERKENA